MSGLLWLGLIVLAVVVRRQWVDVTRLQAEVRRLHRRLDASEPSAAGRGSPEREPATGAPAAPSATPAASSASAATPARGAPPPARPTPRAGAPAARVPPRRTAERFPLESFVGGRLLLVAGVVAVLLGLAFFMKYAVDRGWIGPPARIAMGVAAGVVALLGGDRLRARGLVVYGHALMGLGLGALYLSNHFAAVRYGFLERPAAFALAGALAALGAALAIGRNARLLAYLGFLGGYLAPALLGRDVDALGALGGWLAVLHLGLVAVLWARPWRGLDVMALLATGAYYARWRERFLVDERVDAALLFLATMVACLLLLGLLPALARRRPLHETALLTALLAGLSGFVAAHELLYPDRRMLLGAGVLALAGTYFACARLAASRARAPDARDEHGALALAVFGLASLAAAVPVMLRGLAIAPAWAAAGTATLFLGARRRRNAIETCGVAMIALAGWDLVVHRLPVHAVADTPFVNGRFLSFATPCAASALGAWILHRAGRHRAGAGVLLGLGVWSFTPLLAHELWAHHGLLPAAERDAAARQLAEAVRAAGLAAWLALLARAARGRGAAAAAVLLVPFAGALLAGLSLAVEGHRVDFVPLANPVFLGALSVGAASWYAAACLRGPGAAAALWAATAFGLVLLAAEFAAHGELIDAGAGSRQDARFRAQLGVSVAWAVYGAALLVLGFVRRRPPLRWAGLTALLLTLAKVFVVDMAGLATVYRIGSFLVLGLTLVAVSYLYQRARPAT